MTRGMGLGQSLAFLMVVAAGCLVSCVESTGTTDGTTRSERVRPRRAGSLYVLLSDAGGSAQDAPDDVDVNLTPSDYAVAFKRLVLKQVDEATGVTSLEVELLGAETIDEGPDRGSGRCDHGGRADGGCADGRHVQPVWTSRSSTWT